jgi:hypothetical protein
MEMKSGELLKKLKALGAVLFVDTLLFDDYAWFFPTRSGDEYEDVRKAFSEIFGNDPSDIAVVGSGKYGYSLSPRKNFGNYIPS